MARGWESKSIEAQQDEAARERRTAAPATTPGEQRRDTRRQTLELARARTIADLARARVPSYRAMLEQALAAIDRELTGGGDPESRS